MLHDVHVPTPLRSYTKGAAKTSAEGGTVDQILVDLDRRHPGIRYRMIDEQDRIRTHIRIFVGAAPSELRDPVPDGADVTIICAISGG